MLSLVFKQVLNHADKGSCGIKKGSPARNEILQDSRLVSFGKMRDLSAVMFAQMPLDDHGQARVHGSLNPESGIAVAHLSQ